MKLTTLFLLLYSVALGSTISSNITGNCGEEFTTSSYLNVTCPGRQGGALLGSVSEFASPSDGSFFAAAASGGIAWITSQATFLDEVVVTGGSGSGVANFLICSHPQGMVDAEAKAMVRFGSMSIQMTEYDLNPGGGCNGPTQTVTPVAFTFGIPFQETAWVMANSSSGFSDEDIHAQVDLSYRLVSISDPSGNDVESAHLTEASEPATTSLLAVLLIAVVWKWRRNLLFLLHRDGC